MEVLSTSITSKMICRACLSEAEPYIDLFDCVHLTELEEKITICNMLSTVAYIEIQSADGLPEGICQTCLEKVNISYNFKILCERSDATLREITKHNLKGDDQRHTSVSPPVLLVRPQGISIMAKETTSQHHGNQSNICQNIIFEQINEEMDISEFGEKICYVTDTDQLIECRTNEHSDDRVTGLIPVDETEDYDKVNDVENILDCVEVADAAEDVGERVIMDTMDEDMFDRMLLIDGKEMSRNMMAPIGDNKSTEYPLEIIVLPQTCINNQTIKKSETNYNLKEVSSFPQGTKCLICSKMFEGRREMHAHRKTHIKNDRYQCPRCLKLFTRFGTLNQHFKTHSEEKTCLCPVCGKRFHHRGLLQQHMNRHSDNKTHACESCDKRFYTPCLLRDHIRYKHSGNRDYTCNICGKSFTAKSTLITHMRIHTGERLHICEICGKHFTRAIYLKEHVRKHSNLPPNRKFPCNYDNCNRSYATKVSLQLHIRHVHTLERPYSCETCSKSFTSTPGLVAHRRIHTGEKPFRCPFCDNRFVSKQSVTKHISLHTGERPYKCTFCEEAFISSSRRSDHVLSKHTEKKEKCPLCPKMFHRRRSLRTHIKLHETGKMKKKISTNKLAQNICIINNKFVPEPDFEITL